MTSLHPPPGICTDDKIVRYLSDLTKFICASASALFVYSLTRYSFFAFNQLMVSTQTLSLVHFS